MFHAVDHVRGQLNTLRNESEFKVLFQDVTNLCQKYDITPVTLPRQRRPPLRYSGSGESHLHETAEDHFRSAFCQAVDTALSQLTFRLDRDSIAMRT